MARRASPSSPSSRSRGRAGKGAWPGPRVPKVTEIAGAHDATPAQVRLAWTLHLGAHGLAIPGTGDVDHLEENVAAGALALTDGEKSRLGGDDAAVEG